MSIRMMTGEEKADQANVEIVRDYSGHEEGRPCHSYNCPKNNKYENGQPLPIDSDCVDGCRGMKPLYMETTFEGCVLNTYERNGSDDSDFYASVWNEETQAIESIQYATTRGWSYPNGAWVDATPEIKEKANKYLEQASRESWSKRQVEESKIPEKGRAVVVARGRKIPKGTTGVVFWYGKGKSFSGSRWENPPMRIGFKDDSGETYWTNASNVDVINPEQYQRPEADFNFRPVYGDWNGAKYRVGISIGNTAVAIN